ncbi:MAG: lycopene cyclase family protein, partial [Myxococcota bacterium]
RPVVYTHPDKRFDLERTYVFLENHALRARLIATAEEHGALMVRGSAHAVTHTRTHSVVAVGGGALTARLVVDATGHKTRLVQRAASPLPGVQTAWGVELGEGAHALGLGDVEREMVLMDFRPWADTPAHEQPTFLYGMKRGERVFFEETSLVSRPEMRLDTLEHRLKMRLKSRRFTYEDGDIEEIERCWIPMGGALPDLDQRVVGFGGAAVMVQPASGYQIARALGWSPGLASAIAAGLDERLDPERLAAQAWNTMWTQERIKQRELYLYGLEAMLDFDAARTRAFFTSFFELPTPLWSGYLCGTLGRARLAEVMLRVFGRASAGTRLDLMRPALGSKGLHLLKGLMP